MSTGRWVFKIFHISSFIIHHSSFPPLISQLSVLNSSFINPTAHFSTLSAQFIIHKSHHSFLNSQCSIHTSSFTLHHSSFIIHHSSFILHTSKKTRQKTIFFCDRNHNHSILMVILLLRVIKHFKKITAFILFNLHCYFMQ
jgi:hypothetical protein